jgi:hypothetical protein
MANQFKKIILQSMKSVTSGISGKFFRLVTLVLFLMIGSAIQAQGQKEVKDQTYIISDNGSVMNVQPYVDAMSNSDFTSHRLLNKRHTIVFETGVKIELFSAKEIAKNGLTVNLSDYQEDFTSTRREPVFVLGANNFIIEYHSKGTKHN